MCNDNRPTPVISSMDWRLQEAQLVLTNGSDLSKVMAWIAKDGRFYFDSKVDLEKCQATDAQVVLTNRHDLSEVMAWLSKDGILYFKGKMGAKVCQTVMKEVGEQGHCCKATYR